MRWPRAGSCAEWWVAHWPEPFCPLLPDAPPEPMALQPLPNPTQGRALRAQLRTFTKGTARPQRVQVHLCHLSAAAHAAVVATARRRRWFPSMACTPSAVAVDRPAQLIHIPRQVNV